MKNGLKIIVSLLSQARLKSVPSRKVNRLPEVPWAQRAKKVVSDSPGLVDFSIGLENSVLNLPDGQVRIFRRSKITEVL